MILLAALLAALAAPAQPDATTVITVPASHRLIEGIATDGETIWLSSVIDREILEWRPHRALRARHMPPDAARPLGLAYDAKRRWLWIATDCPEIVAADTCTGGGLIALDRAGRLVARLAPPTGVAHFGDVSVTDGVVHVGDSSNGAVYRCRDTCTVLETVIPPGIGGSAQGSAVFGGAGEVLVADYSAGLARVDQAGKRTLLPREDGRPLRGVDGLVRSGDWFIGVQNSQAPGVVFAFHVSADRQHITDLRGLGGDRVFPEPTQIVVAGGKLYVVADAQWTAYDKGQVQRPAQHATPVMMMPVPR
ncbi:MAG: hypothetical protein JWL96_3410 [Sphingomonas bacterium]|uniref:hypothetical protein n=1 Tax=Sphingomonas bacterium TaxID=1895847 RepID=UPI00261CC5F1|nr:hypothetical protein [Sphingomonas bacterium]MDB5711340.1 hypothetical protein [Sphingomonas bacterium]